MNQQYDVFLTEIKKLQHDNLLIIVEGNSDKAALEKLNINNIYPLNKQALYKVVDAVKEQKEIIILTDLDQEGKKLYAILKKQLNNHGVKVNDHFRNFLFKETDVRQIEGLFTHVQKHNINRYEI